MFLLNVYNRLGIKAKILLIGLVPLVLAAVFLVVMAIGSLKQNLLQMSKESILTETQIGVAEVERSNQATIDVIRTMATAQESGLFGRRTESIEFVRTMLALYPQFTGASVGYEPNADQDDAVYLEDHPGEASAMDPAGRFLPYWYRDSEDPSVLKLAPLIDMETSYYYQGNKEQFLTGSDTTSFLEISTYYDQVRETLPPGQPERYIITEPYEYEGKLIMEQTYPIVIDGKFMGIASVDRSLDDLDYFLSHLKPFASADFILISGRGRIVSATMSPDLETERFEETVFAPILKGFYLGKHHGEILTYTDPLDGKAYFCTATKTKTGRWTVFMRVSVDEIMRPITEKLIVMTSTAAAGVFAIILILLMLANAITRRLVYAAGIACQIAEGDLNVRVECGASADETGRLLGSIRTMIEKLRSLIGQVRSSGIQVMSTATMLHSSAEEQQRTVGDFGTSSVEIAASIKEISATAQELARTMSRVSKTAGEATELAKSGSSHLYSMETRMGQLGKNTDSISQKLSIIKEKTDNINTVVMAITKVADQTNLLSLNASIEAEKAGEHGLGFAVVAREVRRLADHTAVATLDIKRMVQDMQSAVSSGVMEMDKFTQEVRSGVEEVRSASEQLLQVIEHVQDFAPQFQTVTEGMASQSQGAEQISNALTQLSEAAQLTDASVKETSQAADSLQGSVQALNKEIRQFKLDDETGEGDA
jgi:methyl-accepting chemotaxis protein WspA